MRPKTTGVLTGLMGAIAITLVFASIAALGSMFPFLRFLPSSPPAPAQAAEVVKIDSISASGTPAEKVITSVMKGLPDRLGAFGSAAVGPNRPSTLPGLSECASKVVPSLSMTRAWAGGSWVNPAGVTVTTSAFPAGMGGAAMRAQRDSGCGGADGDDSQMHGYLSSGASWSATRLGDVIVVMTAKGTSFPDGVRKDIVARLSKALGGVCADLGSSSDDAVRNPYQNAANFKGRLVNKKVESNIALPERAVFTPATFLPDVSEPQKPDFPYWPLSLPATVSKPTYPQPIEYPTMTRNVSVRVEDVTGPGCGWSFTGMVAPKYDAKKVDASNAAIVAAAQADIKKGADDYTMKVAAWNKAYAVYQADVEKYLTYSTEVARIGGMWSQQRDAQDKYKSALARYESAVSERDSFIARREAASKQYESDVNYCENFDYTPKVTTSTVTPKPVRSTDYVDVPTTTMVTPDPVVSTSQPAPTMDPSSSAMVTPPPVVTTSQPAPTAVPTTTPSAVVSESTPAPYTTSKTEVPQPTIKCPPARPGILDWAVPVVPEKPTPPADPRPADAR